MEKNRQILSNDKSRPTKSPDFIVRLSSALIRGCCRLCKVTSEFDAQADYKRLVIIDGYVTDNGLMKVTSSL